MQSMMVIEEEVTQPFFLFPVQPLREKHFQPSTSHRCQRDEAGDFSPSLHTTTQIWAGVRCQKSKFTFVWHGYSPPPPRAPILSHRQGNRQVIWKNNTQKQLPYSVIFELIVSLSFKWSSWSSESQNLKTLLTWRRPRPSLHYYLQKTW